MVALKRLSVLAILGTAMAFGAASAHVLEAGQCGPIADMGAQLSQEGQAAFGKGGRNTTPDEMKIMGALRPMAVGVIYFVNSDASKGYIAKTDRPLDQGPTQMCIDHVIGNLVIADARTSSSQTQFVKSSMLGAYLANLAGKQGYVMFQADMLKKTASDYVPEGTIVTATANFNNLSDAYKNAGTVFFTNQKTGGTSTLYTTGEMAYTKNGLKYLASKVRGRP
jgi:hypothetical protein